MDATEDRDIYLLRASSELITELCDSLPRVVWASSRQLPGSLGRRQHARKLVKSRTVSDLIRLLDHFQEEPQLLDPSLNTLLVPLVEAYIDCLGRGTDEYYSHPKRTATYILPLPRAICRLLYTLCKVRGPKVIARFLNNEPKYLEPILDAFQQWSQIGEPLDANRVESCYITMMWEEKYIMLLWLAHLQLTPFDLASVGSQRSFRLGALPETICLPPDLPEIAERLISVSIENLVSAGKEREAAVTLLVRLVLRPDMQKLGLLKASLDWAFLSLNDQTESSRAVSIYTHIGVLSFIAGIVTSVDATTFEPFLLPVFRCIQKLNLQSTPLSKDIVSSALARKKIIKILRGITITVLQLNTSMPSPAVSTLFETVLEDVVEHLLTVLADKDTPVRFAASKSLSIITGKLQPTMAFEIVEAVVDSLQENVLWIDTNLGYNEADLGQKNSGFRTRKHDLTAVNPLRWQGLVLTLSHLLFRRTPSPVQLPVVLNALILALSFEQRSSSGNSTGNSVRDAACFGIWSLARRYTTSELLIVDISTVQAAKIDHKVSILQVLANELVVTATLDPAGNIRRGASAALQEMIGRHPDTVREGINLVQVVDYHAVALRSNALKKVAIGAAKLDKLYWIVLLNGMLEWRGVNATDAESRRSAAEAIGLMCALRGSIGIELTTRGVWVKVKELKSREVEMRHGLLLSASAILRNSYPSEKAMGTSLKLMDFWKIFEVEVLHEKDFASSILRPELTAEAACSLISALASMSSSIKTTIEWPTSEVLTKCATFVTLSLARTEEIVKQSASLAARDLLELEDETVRMKMVGTWVESLSLQHRNRKQSVSGGAGYLAALGAVYSYFRHDTTMQGRILGTITGCAGLGINIDTRVAALKSLKEGVIPCGVLNDTIMESIMNGLEDYTTDQRGDIGSLVRLEAIDAVHALWKRGILTRSSDSHRCLAAVCGLAVEKLDKVRYRAWVCLAEVWPEFGQERSPSMFLDVVQTSSVQYFLQVLSLVSTDWLRLPLLEGYATSAGVGAESLLRTSREALVTYLVKLDESERFIFWDCILDILDKNQSNDRILVAILEVVGFLLEMRLLPQQYSKLSRLFRTVQKSHYKSSSFPKLKAAINIYAGLAVLEFIKQDSLMRLAGMLFHPFPNIRNLAADALYSATENQSLTHIDWSQHPNQLKTNATRIRQEIKMSH